MSSVNIDDLAAIIVNDMQDVIDADAEALEGNARATGRKAVRLLRERSRKRQHHGGGYAKSWTADVETDETGTSCTVHNRQYQLTHLLEQGHAIANQSGRYPGHVAGDHVIEGVYNEVAAEFAKGGER